MDQRIHRVMRAAHQHGAESVRLEDGIVHISFRKLESHREIGFLEFRIDDRVRLIDYRQSGCDAGQRWGAGVAIWASRADAEFRGSLHREDCASLPN